MNVLIALAEHGDAFTYQNFATHSERGYPEAFSPEWTAWTARVEHAIGESFSEHSASNRLMVSARNVQTLGWDRSEFEQCKGAYQAAIREGISALKDDTFDELLKREVAKAPMDLSNKVFIVHGHDDATKNELEIMLRDMGMEPVVLHRQIDGGMTIIEKFEHHADVGYAFILLTPDEIAYVASEEGKPDRDRKKETRARPNVIWEFGYFVGRLGRNRTCCLHKGKVVLPSDLNGLVYKAFTNSVEELGWSIQKELRSLGYVLK